MEDREAGISYTEFSYMLLRAFDFYGAVRAITMANCGESVTGGSDQWGNITAGIELTSQKIRQTTVFGLTLPLITNTDGTKFGKTGSWRHLARPEENQRL